METNEKRIKMKRIFALLLVLLLVFSLVGCSSKAPLKNLNYRYTVNEYEYYDLFFCEDTVKLSYQTLVDFPRDPSGKKADERTLLGEYAYEYDKSTKNKIIVDGMPYFYELNEDTKNLTFTNDEFLGIAKYWEFAGDYN